MTQVTGAGSRFGTWIENRQQWQTIGSQLEFVSALVEIWLLDWGGSWMGAGAIAWFFVCALWGPFLIDMDGHLFDTDELQLDDLLKVSPWRLVQVET